MEICPFAPFTDMPGPWVGHGGSLQQVPLRLGRGRLRWLSTYLG
jgi:hypothetical protein